MLRSFQVSFVGCLIMANYVDTPDEGKVDSNDSQLDLWLKDNNLSDAIPVFQKEKMTFNELLSLGEDISFLRQYLSLSTRITSKINQLLKNRDNNYESEEKKEDLQHLRTRIIISEEEDEAINKLQEYENNLSLSIKSLSALNNEITKRENELKSEINAQFNGLINQISLKQEQVLKDLNDKVSKYQSEINNKSGSISQTAESVATAIKSCESMINSNQIDRNQRKKQVLSIANDILPTKQPKPASTKYTIDFQLDHESISPVTFYL